MREGAAREAAHKGAALQSITEAEMVAVFNYLTGAGDWGAGAGGQPSKLQKMTLVQAIVGGGGAAGPEGQRVQKNIAHASAGDSAGDKGATAAPPYTAQHVDAGQRVASGGSAGGGGGRAAGQEGDVANVGVQPLRLRVEAVSCLDLLMNSSSVCLVCGVQTEEAYPVLQHCRQ
jgi:hypothetical protein